MTEQPKPRMLAMGMATTALSDPAFYDAVPEFRTLRPKFQTMRANIQQKGGCGGCRKRRAVGNIYRDFVQTTMALDEDGRARLRNYFGGALMVSRQNPTTKRFETRNI